jgi:hypothetical protein
MLLKQFVFSGTFLIFVNGALSNDSERTGLLEGHLKIVAPKTVDIADANTPAVAASYAEYPLIILSRDGKKEIKRIMADSNGNYRVALPPGDYLLDVEGRARGHARAKVKEFTVILSQTVRADMDLDTGVR